MHISTSHQGAAEVPYELAEVVLVLPSGNGFGERKRKQKKTHNDISAKCFNKTCRL